MFFYKLFSRSYLCHVSVPEHLEEEHALTFCGLFRFNYYNGYNITQVFYAKFLGTCYFSIAEKFWKPG